MHHLIVHIAQMAVLAAIGIGLASVFRAATHFSDIPPAQDVLDAMAQQRERDDFKLWERETSQ